MSNSGSVIKTYDELKKVCSEINTPWLNKYFKEFTHNAFWGVKGDKDMIPIAHDRLERMAKILKSRGYEVDQMAVINDVIRLWNPGVAD